MSGSHAARTEGVPSAPVPVIRVGAGTAEGEEMRPLNRNLPLFRPGFRSATL
jgi:hypothetical protein